jgi:hypothetical protein
MQNRKNSKRWFSEQFGEQGVFNVVVEDQGWCWIASEMMQQVQHGLIVTTAGHVGVFACFSNGKQTADSGVGQVD